LIDRNVVLNIKIINSLIPLKLPSNNIGLLSVYIHMGNIVI
jgi:hypothetical protein